MRGESKRVYTTHPEAYPVGRRKPLNPRSWTEQVLCGSVLNLPVVWDSRILGTLNLLHEEGWYDAGDSSVGLLFAALAIPAYLALERP